MTSLGEDCYVGTLNYSKLIKDTPAPQTIMLSGQFENVFVAADGTDFMEWVSNPTPADILPSLLMPFDCVLKKITAVYKGTNTLQVSAPNKWLIDIGTMTPDLKTTSLNFNTFTDGIGVMEWNVADNGTYPIKVSDINIPVKAGDTLAVIGREFGFIGPNNIEVQISILLEKN